MTLLSVIVPAFNSEEYLKRCIDSLLIGRDATQVIIVNDGSTDSTSEIAHSYSQEYPGWIEVIDKVNGGHGSAINSGLEHAEGTYVKIVDSDDWLDSDAYREVLRQLRQFNNMGSGVDLLLTNFVYEKEGKLKKKAEDYTNALPVGRVFGWSEVGRFRPWQYLLMHTMIYRTEVLRESGLKLPEHSFYVDNLYAFVPLPAVDSLFYMNVNLYRYFIGRADQSVNEKVMIGRLDQQEKINLTMFTQMSQLSDSIRPIPNLLRYMLHYLGVITLVTSVLLVRCEETRYTEARAEFWRKLQRLDPLLASYMRHRVLGRAVNIPGKIGVWVVNFGYILAKAIIGFN